MEKTVVHVLGTLDRGGAETVALDLCRAIPPATVEQHFFCLRAREGALADDFKRAGAVVHLCPIAPIWSFPFRLYRQLRIVRPDAIVSHISLVSGFVLLIARAAGVPVRVARVHSEGDGRSYRIGRRVFRGLARAALRLSGASVAGVSVACLEFAAGRPLKGAIDGERYVLMPNGVDTSRFMYRTGLRMIPPLLVHIGRADPVKNRRLAVAIHSELEASGFLHRFRLVGPGGVGDLDGEDLATVQVWGETQQIPELLGESAVLVLPSIREGQPGVVLEALACGVPVVGSDIPALRELSRALPGIRLVSLGAPVCDWAQAVRDMAELDEDSRRSISAAVHDSIYTLARNVDAWLATW